MSSVNTFTWEYVSSRGFCSVDDGTHAALEPSLSAGRRICWSCASWRECDAPWDSNGRGEEGKGTAGPSSSAGPRPGPPSPGTSPCPIASPGALIHLQSSPRLPEALLQRSTHQGKSLLKRQRTLLSSLRVFMECADIRFTVIFFHAMLRVIPPSLSDPLWLKPQELLYSPGY